jgi:putative acetyltransferase
LSAPFRALGLAPVAVRVGRRRQGIADRLIRVGIDLARAGGWQALFVLGEPDYYGRFGFSASAAARYDCVYAGPYLMALPLGPDLPAPNGAVSYAPAFGALGGDQ